jgi:UDP-2,3-diacylglucosamine pyrophosphatase LpxH
MASRRKVQVCIISDVHLGTYGCMAKELNQYLRSIDPDMLIINGDWLDIWNFGANYWPPEHTESLFIVFDFVRRGIPVYYLTGNHDDVMRRFSDYKLDTLELRDELFLELDGKTHWIFHGDIFDLSVNNKARWLAKLGGRSYDYLIRINRIINFAREQMGKEKIMLSKSIKDSVKKVVKKKVSDFEEIAIERGLKHGYDFVICGHVHKPQIREVVTEKASLTYLNSGDWVENLTALEYNDGEWKLFYYHNDLQFKNIKRE